MMARDLTEREKLAVLEEQMKSLLGNGQPGRIEKIEDEQKSHGRYLWIGMGGLYVLHFLAANGLLKFGH